jgi:HD superfamily phosphohydrolase
MTRCIIGAEYSEYPTEGTPSQSKVEQDLQNCFIRMLNARVGFDVDSLDYIVRDTVDSGYTNMSVDYERLFRSMTICRDEDNEKHQLAFSEDGISAIFGALEARNNIYEEVYPHHKVTFVNSFL